MTKLFGYGRIIGMTRAKKPNDGVDAGGLEGKSLGWIVEGNKTKTGQRSVLFAVVKLGGCKNDDCADLVLPDDSITFD